MDALGLRRAHLIGNSMGGRVALEVGLRYPERVGRLALLAPSLAWRRERPWAPLLRVLRPELRAPNLSGRAEARHLELDCGHVPQVERPAETHRAITAFFKEARLPKSSPAPLTRWRIPRNHDGEALSRRNASDPAA
jgi:pimeloyl-ACP methyl ester carboxylesterase